MAAACVSLASALMRCSACVLSSWRARPPPSQYWQKLVILGFDGMDPDLVRQWIGEGKLPNMKRLDRAGRALPARHDALGGVADRVGVVRDRRQPRQAQHLRLPGARHRRPTCPTSAWCAREPPTFLFDYVPIAKPKVHSIRGGTSFWVTAGQRRRPHRAC